MLDQLLDLKQAGASTRSELTLLWFGGVLHMFGSQDPKDHSRLDDLQNTWPNLKHTQASTHGEYRQTPDLCWAAQVYFAYTEDGGAQRAETRPQPQKNGH